MLSGAVRRRRRFSTEPTRYVSGTVAATSTTARAMTTGTTRWMRSICARVTAAAAVGPSTVRVGTGGEGVVGDWVVPPAKERLTSLPKHPCPRPSPQVGEGGVLSAKSHDLE